jgi:[acyl-carrier-protein] S-malonyltransferase
MREQPHTALLFPGQGSHEEGMRETVADFRPDLLELAIELVGDDPFDHVADGTRFAQPAIYCASLAGWERLGRPEPAAAAGHSLGELAALAAAGAIDHADALRLAARRGELMQEAAEQGGGGMLAVLGSPELATEIASTTGLTVANENAPDETILAGPGDALDEARRQVRERGARAIRLPVKGAFHSPEMEPALAGYRAALEATEFFDPSFPVHSCISTQPFASPRNELASALVLPVRWRDTVLALLHRGIDDWVETGPGTVLTRLVDRNLEALETTNA